MYWVFLSLQTCTACLAASGSQPGCLFVELVVVHMVDSSLVVNRIAEPNHVIQVIRSHIPLPPHKGDQDWNTQKHICLLYGHTPPFKDRLFWTGM